MHGSDLGKTIHDFSLQAQVWNGSVFGHIGVKKWRVLARFGRTQRCLANYESN